MSIKDWFKFTKKDELTIATEVAQRQLGIDQQRVIASEAALAAARVALNLSIDAAEENASTVAEWLEKKIDAAKSAQLKEEADASDAIQTINEKLTATLQDFEAMYRASCQRAQTRHDQQVGKIAGQVNADRDKMLVDLDGAASVLEAAQRTAVGW